MRDNGGAGVTDSGMVHMDTDRRMGGWDHVM